MKKQWIWIVVAVALVALLVAAGLLYDRLQKDFQPDALATKPEETSTEPQRQQAPQIKVYDPEGKPVELADMVGKPVVLNVWASWCNPCKQEMPDFQSAYEKYGDQLHFMMVNLTGQDTRIDAESLIQQAGYTFPVYYDTDDSAARQYNTGSIPATFFIDAKGNLVTYAIGSINTEVLEQGIGMITE